MASNELAAKLQKRTDIIDRAEDGEEPTTSERPRVKEYDPYTEFHEFSRKEIQNFQKMFNQ